METLNDFDLFLKEKKSNCFDCGKEINLFNRISICDACGEFVCKNCEEYSFIPKFFLETKTKVCKTCNKQLKEEEEELKGTKEVNFENEIKALKLKIMIIAFEWNKEELYDFLILANLLSADGHFVSLISEEKMESFVKEKCKAIQFHPFPSPLSQFYLSSTFKNSQKQRSPPSLSSYLFHHSSFLNQFLNFSLQYSKRKLPFFFLFLFLFNLLFPKKKKNY